MDTLMLPTCPRCASYVYPDWTSCKICGYDPENSLTHTAFTLPPSERERFPWGELAASVLGLVVVAALCVAGVRLGQELWERGAPSPERQYVVTVPR